LLDRANEFFISKREFFTLVTAIVAALAILFNNDAPQIAAVRSVMVESLAAVKGNMMWTSRLATSQQELPAQVQQVRLFYTPLLELH